MKISFFYAAIFILLISCKEECLDHSQSPKENEIQMVDFASILSKVVYDRKDVREFLKK
ncbi:MAG: hypothetical protein JW855_00235 [Gammaproteobacteria bacterium]|nr:hypothetical protein [Gammaproteobacteria bacterium]